MKVLYDISVLGCAQTNPLARTGVYRVVENVARGLKALEECELSFCETLSFPVLQGCLAYLESNLEFRNIPLIHSNFLIHFYLKYKDLERLVDNRIMTSNTVDDTLKLSATANNLYQSLREVRKNLEREYIESSEVPEDTDIFHATYYPLPQFVNNKKVTRFLTICDLIPILYPQFFGQERPEDHIVYHALKSIDRDRDFIICISQATKNDVCNYLKIDPNRVFVTYLAASPSIFYPCSDLQKIQSVKQSYGIPNGPYLLSLSTLEPRKNIISVIRSFIKIVREEKISDLCLVLVGNLGWNYENIFAEISQYPDVKNRIIITGRIADDDLAAVYSDALAFIYPSLYEGFGLPPLEAMQCGIPIIVSNTSSLPEVVGNAGITVEPQNIDSLCQSILQLYSDSALQKKLSQKSLDRAKNFCWEKCSRETFSAYQTASNTQL
ncbi:MAG: glycosyltransferase family 1 protein [Cyanobacteria bacterium P01_E01_bin.42]